MVSLGQLTANSIGDGQLFNWIWLIELLVSGILVLFFLFYFNRLFATLVSYGLRAYTWHKFKVYIDIQALQISFLAGRIFFTGVRYHAENETILVQNGYITWTYWLRTVRQVELGRHQEPASREANEKEQDQDASPPTLEPVHLDAERGPGSRADNASARITVHVSGLEWFVYNRTPVYDAILADSTVLPDEKSATHADRSSFERTPPVLAGKKDHGHSNLATAHARNGHSSSPSEIVDESPASSEERESDWLKQQPTRSSVGSMPEELSGNLVLSQALILRFLPLFIECQKGAIILGNETTRALLVTTFEKARGHVDATASGALDIFKQLFDFDIDHPVIQMKPNPDFKHSQQAAAEKAIFNNATGPGKHPHLSRVWRIRHHRHKLLHSLRSLVPYFRKSVESFHASTSNESPAFPQNAWYTTEPERGDWLGLNRYLDDDLRDDHEGWTHVDYARYSTLLDCPSIHFTFYWDIPGEVRPPPMAHAVHKAADINQAEPPTYGMDITIRGGMVNYGPWTDRLRAEIQTAFLPNGYHSVSPADVLSPGSPRQSTRMTIRIDVEAAVSMRVPTRESSKDWQWKGRADALRLAAQQKKQGGKRHFRFRRSNKTTFGPDIRPFGWMSFSVAANSTVRYEMDLVPGKSGYYNRLELDLKDTKATSSVNHGLLWRCKNQRLSCDLSNPLIWNGLHQWTFDIQNEAMEMFLLRDHMFLLIDLIDDFTAGIKPEYMTFVPFRYVIDLTFTEIKLYLNSNDANIINNPSDLDDNIFLILGFQELKGCVDIPIHRFAASQNSVLFKGSGQNATMDLSTPPWHTLETFVTRDPVALLKDLTLDGSYNYCATISPTSTDCLILDIEGGGLRLFVHGFLIRYFVNMKENYFGEEPHFRTLEEYQDFIATPEKQLEHNVPSRKENELDVILTVRASRACALLPANLYARKENVRLDILLGEADMRFTNYYMDLQVRTSPIEACLETIATEGVGISDAITNCQIFIDGANVTGHRLFGAPPTEPAYVSSWDVEIGDTSGEISVIFLLKLILAIQAFAFTLEDDENALPPFRPTIIPDIVFVTVDTGSINLWLVAEEAAFMTKIPSCHVSMNDWAGPQFSMQLQVSVPEIAVAVVDRISAARHRQGDVHMVKTLAFFRTALHLRMISKMPHFAAARAIQQHHLRYHDRRSRRAGFLIRGSAKGMSSLKQADWASTPPAMPVPMFAQPVSALLHPNSHGAVPMNTQALVLRQGSVFLSTSSFSSKQKSYSRPRHSRREASKLRSDGLSGPQQPDDMTSTSNTVFASSPWTPPHFMFSRVQPDLKHMPHLEKLSKDSSPTSGEAVNWPNTDTEASGARALSHKGFICQLPHGLVGFCLPNVFPAIASLIESLQPRHPTDCLDAMQTQTVSRLMSASMAARKSQEIIDLSVFVPLVHLRVISGPAPGQPSDWEDQYEVVADQVRLTGRIPVVSKESENGKPGYGSVPLVHASAKMLSITAIENGAPTGETNASAKASLTDLAFWMGGRDSIRAKLRLRGVELLTSGHDVADLAALIQHTGSMIEELIPPFLRLGNRQALQHTVYALTSQGTDLEPLFLTRPSYVLRTADHHLRLNDSWKAIARLRYLYSILPSASRIELFDACSERNLHSPDDARRQIIATFDQWRSWDDEYLGKVPIVDAIFGPTMTEREDASMSHPFDIDTAIEGTKIALDTGDSQSALVLGDIGFTVSSSTTRGGASQKDLLRKLRVQSFVSQVAMNIEWDLIELLGDTVAFFRNLEGSLPSPSAGSNADRKPQTPQVDLVVVVGTDNATISVSTPNVCLRLAGRKMSMSTTLITSSDGRHNSNTVVASDTSSVKIKGNGKTLMAWRIYLPTVFVSHVSDSHTLRSAKDLRLVAASREVRFDMRREVLFILEVSRRVLEEEVPTMQRIVAQIDQAIPKSATAEASKSTTNIRLALFLDDYRLNFAVSPSFAYIVAGQVARMSIVSRRKSKIGIDFDLKSNTHAFRVRKVDVRSRPPALEIPPINGNILVILGDTVTQLEVKTAVEEITFEAVAVRAVVDALNQPDLARTYVNTKASVQDFKSRVERLIGATPAARKTPSAGTDAVFAYTSYTTLGGLNIHVSAPTINQMDHQAEVNFMLGFTSLCVHNRTAKINVVHEKPQFEALVGEVAVGIRRTSNVEDTYFGKAAVRLHLRGHTEINDTGDRIQQYHMESGGLHVDLYPETALLVTHVVVFIQERIKSFTLNEEARNFKPLRRLTIAGIESRPFPIPPKHGDQDGDTNGALLDSVFSVEIHAVQIRWLLYNTTPTSRRHKLEDLVFSIEKIDLKTKREASARLTITNLQLQMVPKMSDPIARSSNSALLPKVVFNAAYVSTKNDRRLAFQAAGRTLDLRLAADFILPASMLQQSLAKAGKDIRDLDAYRKASPVPNPKGNIGILGGKRLASLLVDADFAGAVVTVKPWSEEIGTSAFAALKGNKRSRAGRYGQAVSGESATEATLRAPGVALKVQYQDDGADDPSLSAEFRVAASSNVLYPSVVPLILEISSIVKEIVGDPEPTSESPGGRSEVPSYLSEAALSNSDPNAILGKCKLNAGLWIQKQEFTLSCQPIARVAATARFDGIFASINTVQAADHDRFFAIVATFNNVNMSVQHVYSRESSANFEVNSIVMSLMNSKHVSAMPGISAILNISPMQADVNVKQLQDFLLFREIWYPPELRKASTTAAPAPPTSDAHVARYQQVAASRSFLWNAVVSVQELKLQVDLGQGIGKSVFVVEKLWASSKKSSDLEQNLCVGFTKVGIDSTGRMSGFVELQNFHLRTSIQWPQDTPVLKKAPLVQGSVGFEHFLVKAAFDYQPFAVADISSFEFLMYNVRQTNEDRDRLVGILDGDKVQVFSIATTPAQVIALYQAFERLVQEKQEAYQSSIAELDRYLRRKSVFPTTTWVNAARTAEDGRDKHKMQFALHTDVVVTLKELDVGIFPTTFFDKQIFKAEATDAQARFAVSTRNGQTHSGLGMTLGQLRVALSSVSRANTQALGEVSVSDVVGRVRESRGGTILKVPKLVMAMSTWQAIDSNTIEYIFKSIFEGKVDVGWNYARISFIRGMWEAHSRALAQRLGKPLTQSAVKITAEPMAGGQIEGQEKITAVVNVPQSRFDYVARAPSIIDTPQLRDLGEATPSVELFGLHRDRLPNVTHQIIVMPLLEVAREVEDAYSKILGSA